MAFNKATEFFKNVKDTIQNKSETEKKLDDALSKQAHFASGTLMQEIARLTFDYMEYPVVMKAVWDGLNHAGKNWRQILKVCLRGLFPGNAALSHAILNPGSATARLHREAWRRASCG